MGTNDVVVGFSSSDDSINNDFTFHEKKPNYAIGSHGVGYRNGKQDLRYGKKWDCPKTQFGSDDIIQLTLNLKLANISMKINDEKIILIFDDVVVSVDVKYKLAIQLPQQFDHVSIQDFSLLYTS